MLPSGQPTTLSDLADLAIRTFSLTSKPQYNTAVGRKWDTDNWFANTSNADEIDELRELIQKQKARREEPVEETTE